MPIIYFSIDNKNQIKLKFDWQKCYLSNSDFAITLTLSSFHFDAEMTLIFQATFTGIKVCIIKYLCY